MIRILILSIASAILLSACGTAHYTCADPLGCFEIASGDPLTMGVLATTTGEDALGGIALLDAVSSAVEEYGLVLGHEVDLVWEGTDCTEASAYLAATRLLQTSSLLAVIGPSCHPDAPIVAPPLQDVGVVLIPPSPNGGLAYLHLVGAIQQVAVQQPDGSLILPRSVLQQALEKNP